jgi:hypothetical protein
MRAKPGPSSFLLALALVSAPGGRSVASQTAEAPRVLNLAQCLDLALEHNTASRLAYQQELVETKDVIEAQLMESLLKANFQKTLFDLAEAQARLQLVVGSEVASILLNQAK